MESDKTKIPESFLPDHKDPEVLGEHISERELVLENILEDTFAGYWDWRIQDGTEYLSPSFKAMFGYADDEMENKPESWQNIIFREDLPIVESNFAAHVQTRGKYPFEQKVRYHHKDGSTVYVICRGRVIEWDEDDEPVRMVGCHVDVTRMAEMENTIVEKNGRLEMVAEGINAGIWDWNIETGAEWWSPKFYELLGFEDGEVPAQYDHFLNQLLHPEDVAPLENALAEHFEGRVPYKLEIRIKSKSGEYRWFETCGQAHFNVAGKPERMVGSIIGIGKRKRFEKRDKESIEILTSQNDRLLNFAHIVSHNLRSHTGNMIALLELLEAEENPTEGKAMLGMVSDAAQQLHDTVEHLSEIVRVQNDINKDRVSISFEQVLAKTMNTLSGEIAVSEVRIEADFKQAPEVNYVSAYIESIFLNLLSNAIKYRSSEREAVVRLSSGVLAGKTFLKVQDNGIGIDLERHGGKLFGLYKTFHKNDDARGVGLFLIKNQIEALGGKIEVESLLEEGSTFTVTF